MSISVEDFSKASSVIFRGFTDSDLPDNGDKMVAGDTYRVSEVVPSDGDEEGFLVLEIPNPDFNSEKRKTKKNPEFLFVECYADEVAAVEAEVAESEAEAEEVAEVEEAPAPKAKPKAKAKAATKSKAKAKAVAEDVAEDAEDAEDAVEEEAPAPKAKAKPKAKAVTKAKAKKEKKVVKQDPEDSTISIIDEKDENPEALALVKASEDLCEDAKEMKRDQSVLEFNLGAFLYHIRLSKAYEDVSDEYAGKGGFTKYVQSELGIGYRTARNHINIYTALSLKGLGADYMAVAGYTKCIPLSAKILKGEDCDELIAIAQDPTVTVEQFADTIKHDTVSEETGETVVVRRTNFKFRLFEDQAANVEEILASAQKELGIDNPDDTFEAIIVQWAMDHLDQGLNKKSRAALPDEEEHLAQEA